MAVKARVLLKLPARIVGGTGIDATLASGTWTISGSVSADNRFLGAIDAGTVQELTGTQATTLLDAFTSSLKGLVPAPGAGGVDRVLQADGSWGEPASATPGGSTLEIQFNSAGSFDGMAGTSWDDTNRSLTLTGATVTTSKPIFDLSQTWNAGGVTFTAIKLTVTSTASAAASKPIEILVGALSVLALRKDGFLTTALGINVNNGSGDVMALYESSGLLLGVSKGITWSSGATIFSIDDLGLRRDAAGILAVSDSGVNANGSIKTRRVITPMTSELTIAAGVITVTGSYHRVDTEADAASDDLDTINGGLDGARLVLRADNAARTVVVKDGTGNIQCAGDFNLDNTQDTIELIFDDTLSAWLELSRSDNGA